MKNADMPANPLPNGADDRPYNFTKDESIRKGHAVGLTKREKIAIAAMQGLCATSDSDGIWTHHKDAVAFTAVAYADALLKELSK